MKSGYDQFFKQVRGQANPKTKVTLNLRDPKASQEKVVRNPSQTKPHRPADTQRGRTKRPLPLPWNFIGACVLGLGISVWGLLSPKSFEDLLNSVDISAFSNAGAAEGEKVAATSAAKEEKSAETKAGGSEKVHGGGSEWSQEEVSFFSKLNERKKELDLREAELNKLEEELQQQKVELEKRLKDLEQTRTQIADTLKNQVEVDKDKVDKLVEFYSNMKPQQAAKIMETLNEDLVVETLGRMKKKNAAEIMNLLDAKKAQSISEKFAGYKRK